MNDLLRTLLQLPVQASEMAFELDVLHYAVIGATLVGALGVALAMAVLSYRSRVVERDLDRADRIASEPHPEAPETPRALEVALVLGLLGLFTGFWVVGYGQFVKIAHADPDAMPIYVSAKQWMWSFAYPNGAGSKGVLYVPLGKPVKLMLTSRDVIHSFYVPAFRLKQDVVPGRMLVTSFTPTRLGRYDVFCAEYCGLSHSRMRGEVRVVTEEAFARYLDGDGARPDTLADGRGDLAQQGRRIAAEKGCLRCHTVDGTAHVGPTWAGLFGAQIQLRDANAVRRSLRVDEAYLTRSMMDPGAEIRVGFDAIMPSYQGRLEAGEVGALVQYIRSLRDAVVPSAGQAPLPAAPLPTGPVTPRAPATGPLDDAGLPAPVQDGGL